MNSAFAIIPIDADHRFAPTVAGWIYERWGAQAGKSRVEVAARLFAHENCPPAHLATDSAAPLGVIAFANFKSPDDGEQSVWIDALFVDPAHRGAGIGSELVRRAHELVRPLHHRIYVYTDVPKFYGRLGWTEIVPADASGCRVLRREWERKTPDAGR